MKRLTNRPNIKGLSPYALMGFATREECRPATENPYSPGTQSHREWNEGWTFYDMAAQRKSKGKLKNDR